MPTTSRPSARRGGPLGPRKPVALAERLERLAALERGLGDHYAHERVTTNLRLAAFAWRVQVTIPAYEETFALLIELDERRAVRVTAEDWVGPMKHTYGQNSLCMWYPSDPLDRRWSRTDGLLKLVDTAVAHLFKELFYRETDEWLGEEAPHAAPKVEPRVVRNPAAWGRVA